MTKKTLFYAGFLLQLLFFFSGLFVSDFTGTPLHELRL